MMNRTKIEYLTHSWSPIAMRCTPVSAGCKNCWHLAMADRLAANPKLPDDVRAAYAGKGPPVLREDELEAPLRLEKQAVIGVQFMGDLFHADVQLGYIRRIWNVMAKCLRHQFILLTKRPERMHIFAQWLAGADDISIAEWPRNVILGVSVENQAAADERIPWLLWTPAAKRVVSYEPALSAVDFFSWLEPDYQGISQQAEWEPVDRNDPRYNAIDWVIAGCESGPRRRPAQLDWFRQVRDQCIAAGTPYFLKQMEVDGKVVKMPALDGKVWEEMP